MADLREKFYYELKEKLEKANIKAIIKISNPSNGFTIKLNGIALFKAIVGSNSFKERGVAVYRNLTDAAIALIGGKRSKGKNKWIVAPLTPENYLRMMEILFVVAQKANEIRNRGMSKAGIRQRKLIEENEIKKGESNKKIVPKPKKKKTK